MKEDKKPFDLTCPTPRLDHSRVLLAHGGGGKLMNQLIETLLLPTFDNPLLASKHDGTVIDLGSRSHHRIAFTTDSYVVQPLFFKGGDIGSLAINGTVNDLAMCGARPLYLSCGLIIEEGLPMETLSKVARSMRKAADAAGVTIVTGDTKVVDKGKGDGIFINTAGIGVLEHALTIAPQSVQPGDAVLINGDIGRHGIAIMAEREGLSFESTIESDCAPLSGLVLDLIGKDVPIHCMRDLTRGGLASALVEIAASSGHTIAIDERAIPVRDDVQGACEILGFDPIYVANEGRFVAFVPEREAARTLDIMRSHPLGAGACKLGIVTNGTGHVHMKSKIGANRIVDMLSGEQLPRIC